MGSFKFKLAVIGVGLMVVALLRFAMGLDIDLKVGILIVCILGFTATTIKDKFF